MTRRRKVLAAAVILAIPGLYVASRLVYPRFMRWRTRSALEWSASNHCACMLGPQGATTRERLTFARAHHLLEADSWPARCKTSGEAALLAFRDASRWDDLGAPISSDAVDAWATLEFLERIQPYEVRAPDPDVPVAQHGSFALDKSKLVPIMPVPDTNGDESPDFRVDRDKLLLTRRFELGPVMDPGDVVIVHPDNRIERPESPRPRLHPNWDALEADPGARHLFFDGAWIVDEQGKHLGPSWVLGVRWGHSYANGRVLAVVSDTDRNQGEATLWDVSPASTVTKLSLEAYASGMNSKSSHFADGWALWKQIDGDVANVVAMDLSKGTSARVVPLGHIDKPGRYLSRSYGTCVTEKTTFVDMDPSLAVHEPGTSSWQYVELQQAIHRHVTCTADSAIVTEWFPLEIRRCTIGGCVLVPFPSPQVVRPYEAFAADEKTLFHLTLLDDAVVLYVHPLADPTKAKGVVLYDKPEPRFFPPPMQVVGGRAMLFFEQSPPDGARRFWGAIAVDPEAKVTVLGAK